MKYPLFSRLFLSRYRNIGTPFIPLAKSQLEGIRTFERQCKDGEYSFEQVACLCGSTKSYCVGLNDRYGLSVESYLCLRCGIIRIDPRMTEESLNKYYTELYGIICQFGVGQEECDSETRLQQRFNEQKLRGEWLHREMQSKLPHGSVVFDIGCNSGAALLPFQEAGCKCFGCDLSTDHFAHGRKEGLTLIEGDETVLSQYGPADFVFLSHVVEHLPHPDRTFKNLRGLLREGGYLYIEVPGILQYHRYEYGMMSFLQNVHLYQFTLGTLSDLARQSGFVLYKGTQVVSGFFTKDQRTTLRVRRHFLRPYLYLAYIFFYRNIIYHKITFSVSCYRHSCSSWCPSCGVGYLGVDQKEMLNYIYAYLHSSACVRSV